MPSQSRINLYFLSVCFVGGCLGGLSNSLFIWLSGLSGLNTALGMSITPQLTPQWLYLRIVWAGLWGLLFYLPILSNMNIYKKAAILMLAPILVQLLIVFPIKLNKGLFGMQLGLLTPALVVLANLVWAFTTAWWISSSAKQSTPITSF